MLPSEAELSQLYAVSRATVREALLQLEGRGLVIRRHGVGTFVSPQAPVFEAGLEQLESLETLARRIGLEAHMGHAAIEEREATAEEAGNLQIEPGSPVLSVARVMEAGEQPVAYLVDVVPTGILRQADLGDDFTGSVLDLILRREQPPLSHSRTDIVIEPADESTARRLHLRRGDPVLTLVADLVARDGRVVDHSFSYFVPGYFRFHVIRRIGGLNGELGGATPPPAGQ
jgi:GntR family transcriptional regulator